MPVADVRTATGASALEPRVAARDPRSWGLLLLVGLVGFAARLAFVLQAGGLRTYGRYDDGVYFAAAAALVHGRLPYRDFLLLHPPGIALALAPFAWLGSLTSDGTGLVVGRVAFHVLGGVSAALVAALLLRRGRAAALVGGLGYAVFLPAVYAERSTLLEPLGTTLTLVALLLLQRRPASSVAAVVAGLVLGASITVKIWYVVPVLVVLGYGLLVLRGRPRWLLPTGVVVSATVVCLPFFALAPAAMWRMVVVDQLGRPQMRSGSMRVRLGSFLGVPPQVNDRGLLTTALILALVLAVAAAAAVAVWVWRDREAVAWTLLMLASVAVLLQSPSYFRHYGALTAAPLALVGGAAAGALTRRATGRVRWATAGLLVAGLVVLESPDYRDGHIGKPLAADTPLVAAVAKVPGCVMADDPTVLALVDGLSRDLERGCPLWPDVTGLTYEDSMRIQRDGHSLPRARNPRWQAAIYRYLTSGDAYLRVRSGTGVSGARKRALNQGDVLARDGKIVLRKTPEPPLQVPPLG